MTRRYNYNKHYINAIIKNSVYTNKEVICKKLYLTKNAFNLKLTERSLIYINEGIIIANELKMDILDVFCPKESQMGNVFCKKIRKGRAVKYNKFNINQKYIKELMKLNNINIDDVCKLWNLKLVSIYDKLRGDTKITVEEGINFALLIGISVNELFCPTQKQVVGVLTREFESKYKKSKKKSVLFVEKVSDIVDKFDMNNINYNKNHVKSLIHSKDVQVKDVAKVWDVSVTHAYSKINGLIPIEFNEALKLGVFLELPLKTIFNPTEEQIKQAQDFHED